MSSQVFSKKEVLGHGFYQTQKFIGFILLMGLIFIVAKGVTNGTDTMAGQHRVAEDPRSALGLSNQEANLLMESLIDQGFVNDKLWVQNPLRYLDTPLELALPPELEPKRTEIFEFLTPYRYRLPFPRSVYFIVRFALFLVNMLMAIGYIKICLAMSRDQKPQLSDLFTHVDLLISYILGSICYFATVIGGGLLLVIPGIIFGIMFQMYSYLIVDKGLGPIAAMQRSREITRGSRMNLFLLGLLIGLINLAGALCFLIGLLWSIPTTSIALATVYDHLEGAGGTGNLEDLVHRV